MTNPPDLHKNRSNKHAIAALEADRKRHPSRQDIKLELARLQRDASPRSRVPLGFHLMMAWVLLIFSAALVYCIGAYAMHLAGFDPLALEVEDHLWLVLSVISASLAALYIFLQLFLHCWFAYCKHVVRGQRCEIEQWLPSALNIVAFEPQ